MLKFQWDALRRGDTVFVHDAGDADPGLRAGVVTLVDVSPSGHGVGIRLTTGTRTGSVVRPGRFAVHLAAGEHHDCWRCSDNRPSDTAAPAIQRKRSFERKVDAVRFSRAVETDLLRGDWIDPRRSGTGARRTDRLGEPGCVCRAAR